MPKCCECGLLGAYDNQETIHEVGDSTRRTALIRDGRSHFVCTAVAAGIDGEINNKIKLAIEAHPSHNIEQNEVNRIRLEVLHCERKCSFYFVWKPGFSPKEHQEVKQMLDLEKLRSEQREKDMRFQEEVRERDRRWRQEDLEAQRKANESFQLRMKKMESRRQILITLFGSILTVLGTMLLFWLGYKSR